MKSKLNFLCLLIYLQLSVIVSQLPGGNRVKDVYYGTLIGKLNTYMHAVSGDVYAVDESTIYIRNFNYDGQGPNTFFWAGNSLKPDERGFIIPDEKGSTKTLEAYNNQNLVIRLPEGKTLRDIRWLSIWCREFKVNFGDLQIPRNLAIPSPVEIPQLSRLAHGVKSAPITIVDAQTLLVPSFHYDGEGPAGYWWATRGPRQSPRGLRLKDENGSPSPLRKYTGETVVISLPDDKTIYDFDNFGVWCEEFNVDFGSVRLPQNVRVPPSPKMLGIKPETKLNCEVLYDDLGFELRWVMDGDDIVMQLVGRVEPNEYMSFGLSKDDSKSEMVNADAVVAWVTPGGSGRAVDYHLGSKEQCVGNRGSCPDMKHRGASDSITLLHAAVVNGFSMITFKRPQLGLDEQFDQHIYSDGQQAVMWGIGPLNERQEVSYHRLHNKGDMFIDFARQPKWNCPLPDDSPTNAQHSGSPPVDAPSQRRPSEDGPTRSQPNRRPQDDAFRNQPSRPQEDSNLRNQANRRPNDETVAADQPQSRPEYSTSNEATQPPRPQASAQKQWTIPPIACPIDTTFRAQIGPTGGSKGYQSIAGRVGWGIAWYINGLLIPEMTLQRGKTYTFIVEGGHDRNNSARRHPLYLTDSVDGGFDFKSDDERQNEQIFGGVGITPDGSIVPTAEGRLCEWKIDTSRRDRPENYDNFFDFQRTLNLECEAGNSGVLRFTPDQNTPDLIYYQCYTHRNLGWKIHIVDNCDALSGQSSIPKISFAKPESTKNKTRDRLDANDVNNSNKVSNKESDKRQTSSNPLNQSTLNTRVYFPEIMRVTNHSVQQLHANQANPEPPKASTNRFNRNPPNANKPLTPPIAPKVQSAGRPGQQIANFGPFPPQPIIPYNGPPPYLFSHIRPPLKQSFSAFPSGPVNVLDHVFRPPPKRPSSSSQSSQTVQTSESIAQNLHGGFVPMLIRTANASIIKQFNSAKLNNTVGQRPVASNGNGVRSNPFNKNTSVPFHQTFKSPNPDFGGFNISRYGELSPKLSAYNPKPVQLSRPLVPPIHSHVKPEIIDIPIRYRLKPQNFLKDKDIKITAPVINEEKISSFISMKDVPLNDYIVDYEDIEVPANNDYSDHMLAVERGSQSSESQKNVAVSGVNNKLNPNTQNGIYGSRLKPISSNPTTDRNLAEVVDESPLKQEAEVSPKTTIVIPLTREQLKNNTDHTILTDVLRLIAQNAPAIAPQDTHIEVHAIDKREIHYEDDGHDHNQHDRNHSHQSGDRSASNHKPSLALPLVSSLIIISLLVFLA